MSRAVDAFIRARVRPEHRPVVRLIRSLMRECAPAASEELRYGLPMWSMGRELAWLSPTKSGITFSFTHGVELSDRWGLLRGTAKHARHVRLARVAEAKPAALRSYIKQSVKLDAARRPPASRAGRAMTMRHG